MQSLKQHRSKQASFADLLNYAAVIEDGIILNKDGSLMAAWYYRGQDLATVSVAERNRISAHVNAALVKLGSEWCLHQDVIRIESKKYPKPEASHFPDLITRLIDEERRMQFESEGKHYENVYTITLTYLPDKAKQAKFGEMMYEDHRQNKTSAADLALRHFKTGINDFIDRLNSILKLYRLKGETYTDAFGQEHTHDHFLSHIHQTITGQMHPIDLPPCPMYLDAVIGGQEFFSGVIPKINDYFIQVVAIEGFPAHSHPGILAELDQIAGVYRWNTRFIFQDPVDANAALKAYKRKWEQQVRGFVDQIFHSKQTSTGVVNRDALEMVEQTETAISENSSGLVAYGYYTSIIALMDTDREKLEQTARAVKRIINNLHFSARVETINTVEAYLGSLPGHAVQNIRRPLLNTLQLADMLPLSSVWPGNETAPCPFYPPNSPPLLYAATDGSTPFRLNLHVGDLGHTLVFGKTGGGKSTALGLIAAQFRRYQNATVFAFDKGRSLEPLTRAIGGDHYDVGNMDNVLAFSPLALIESPTELAWARDWLETLIELQGMKVTAKHRSMILEALEALKDDPEKSLTNLVVNIQDTELKQALKDYTIDGAYGQILDNIDDNLAISQFSVFEIEHLMAQNERIQLPVLLYLFHVIERQMIGQPCLLILDEAWLMLGSPVFRDKIREWLKVLRKANCAVILATQSLSDAVKSGILDVLSESCPTKIFLANPEAENADNQVIYRGMGCNETEIRLISNLIEKREYYVKSLEGKRRVNFGIGRIALAFIGVSDKEGIQAVREHHQTYGEEWPIHWLNSNDIEYQPIMERIV